MKFVPTQNVIREAIEEKFQGQEVQNELVHAVQGEDLPIGFVDLGDVVVAEIDVEAGDATYNLDFSAEHSSESLDFDGSIKGSVGFNPRANSYEAFSGSLELKSVRVRFNME